MITQERRPHFGARNKDFHEAIATAANAICQTETEYPAYIGSRDFSPQLQSTAADSGVAEIVKKEFARPNATKLDLDYTDLGLYERVILSALAWGKQYTLYCIVGDMGSGKTAVIKYIAGVLHRPKKALCGLCGVCDPLILKIDFNEGFNSKQETVLLNAFRQRLHDQLRTQLRRQFKASLRVNDFIRFAQQPEHLNLFASFDEFFAGTESNDDWSDLSPAKRANALFAFIASRPELDTKIELLMRLMRYVVLSPRPEPACAVLICDNIDKLRNDAQMSIMLDILSVQRFARMKTLIALRRTSFEKLPSQRAYSFGVINHNAPDVITIAKARLQHFITNFAKEGVTRDLDATAAVHLKRRLSYVLQTLDVGGWPVELLRGLSGDSIRLALSILERTLVNNVLPHDSDPRNPAELCWAMLVGDNDSQVLELNDPYAANVFTNGVSSRLSLLSLRILGLLHTYSDKPARRTFANLVALLRTIDTWSLREIVDAINYLMRDRRPLIWVDGRSAFPVAIDVNGPAAREILFISSIGRHYFRYLTRSLAYFQDAMLALDWSDPNIPTAIDFFDFDSRFSTLRACFSAIQKEDARQVLAFRDTRAVLEPGAPEISLLSNRILYGVAKAAFLIFQAQKSRGMPSREFREWHNQLITSSNLEEKVVGRLSAPLNQLIRDYEKTVSDYPK